MSQFGVGQAGIRLRVRTVEEEGCVGEVSLDEWPQRRRTGTDHGDVQLDEGPLQSYITIPREVVRSSCVDEGDQTEDAKHTTATESMRTSVLLEELPS